MLIFHEDHSKRSELKTRIIKTFDLKNKNLPCMVWLFSEIVVFISVVVVWAVVCLVSFFIVTSLSLVVCVELRIVTVESSFMIVVCLILSVVEFWSTVIAFVVVFDPSTVVLPVVSVMKRGRGARYHKRVFLEFWVSISKSRLGIGIVKNVTWSSGSGVR